MVRKLITADNKALTTMRVGVVSEMTIGYERRQDLEVKTERIKGIKLKVTWLFLYYCIYLLGQRCDASQKIASLLLKRNVSQMQMIMCA